MIEISVVILTFNSERTIAQTLASAQQVSDDISVVDSFSTDGTIDILRKHGVNLVQRPFEHYGAQRNWAIDNLPLRYAWELHLDSDEMLSPALVKELAELKSGAVEGVDGFYIPRLVRFLGRPLRHGGMYPIWHLRLFRRGRGRCENRRYDQHFFVDGNAARLKAPMIDDIQLALGEWVARHNRWAEAEVEETLLGDEEGRIRGDLSGDPVKTKRYLRRIYEDLPIFWRPLLLFIYRYFIRLGFLDGKEGLIFYVLQTFWFRFLVDAKLFERQLALARARKSAESE